MTFEFHTIFVYHKYYSSFDPFSTIDKYRFHSQLTNQTKTTASGSWFADPCCRPQHGRAEHLNASNAQGWMKKGMREWGNSMTFSYDEWMLQRVQH